MFGVFVHPSDSKNESKVGNLEFKFHDLAQTAVTSLRGIKFTFLYVWVGGPKGFINI